MSCPHAGNYRAMEESIKTDFKDDMSYGDYLKLDQILSAQHPLSNEHDEMLFIIIHQTYELWFKQIIHELNGVVNNLKKNDLFPVLKSLDRIITIQKTLIHF